MYIQSLVVSYSSFLPFSSSSAAAAFAVGYSISGPREWKTEKGETLKKYESKDS
ncbi:MAG: DUF4357 domain-containing protein [Clostridia bacterium]|nr:DUF4357 domain-containing protein [Clostridia bacterium]